MLQMLSQWGMDDGTLRIFSFFIVQAETPALGHPSRGEVYLSIALLLMVSLGAYMESQAFRAWLVVSGDRHPKRLV